MKLAALRDFAIAHFPRAQTVDASLPGDDYNRTLYGFAALVSANAPAVVQAAASLLQPVMRLSIAWDAEGRPNAAQRQDMAQQAIDAAHELCTLTGTTIPWLSAASLLTPPVEPAEPVPTLPPAPSRPMLQPGPNQTTEDAARYLGITPGTMRKWVMEGKGPITPVPMGVRHGWPTAELERLARVGWIKGKRGSK